MARMRFRLALNLGCTSLGWALVRLNAENQPSAIIKAGVRIFSDGREPKDGSSLAATRREARAARRRRDRLLKRKERMSQALIDHGFFPAQEAERRALVTLNPYALRAKGLDEALTPAEFARALFHINQRRGFKSNRKTDRQDNTSGALKTAIHKLRLAMQEDGSRTVGEWLHKRMHSGQTVRARYRQTKVTNDDGYTRIDKSYDLYIDRAMIEDEFDCLWARQAQFNPQLFNAQARAELRFTLLFQRPLKPVKPGRCVLLPDEERAPLALPSSQRLRIYQEVNHLHILQDGFKEVPLSLAQRDLVVDALEHNSKLSFAQIKRLLGLPSTDQFNVEDARRPELKGNTTSAVLRRPELFGEAWYGFDEAHQDAIVYQLIKEENEARLIHWLEEHAGVDEFRGATIANAGLPEGYGSLCFSALQRMIPALRSAVQSNDRAVLAAGLAQTNTAAWAQSGGLPEELPYYGRVLQRQVGFGSGKPEDNEEKRFGKIASPTVHIGLNQVRVVVNALIQRYGHPDEVIVELARDLAQSKKQRDEAARQKLEYKRRYTRLRTEIASMLGTTSDRVRTSQIQKMILWQELGMYPADRRCPYSGTQISVSMLLGDQVSIEHILPFSDTLDDSLNNKTVALTRAIQVKGNRTPWQARASFAEQGWEYRDILQRAQKMPKLKRLRFGEEGYARWLGEEPDFLSRALNDGRHLSRAVREYLSVICPQHTRVIPGRLTAALRARLGLNDVLGLEGEKNHDDHRHHAVNACVVGVTDQTLLQRYAWASAIARELAFSAQEEEMPMPWPTFREHVQRAMQSIWVSQKPDHGHEGAMHNDTAYGLLGEGRVQVHKLVDGRRERVEDRLKVIPMTHAKAVERHGLQPDGSQRPYKGYKGDSNYCMEIVRSEKGKWEGEVISTFEAYQIVRLHGLARLRHRHLSVSGRPLVMRLMNGDNLRLELPDCTRTMSLTKISSNGQIFMAQTFEANVDARNRDKDDPFLYTSKMAGSLLTARARRVTISPIGELQDPGFKE